MLDELEMYHSASAISSINDEKSFRDLMVIDYREITTMKIAITDRITEISEFDKPLTDLGA
ncbi:hypothetical protein [Bartonella tribocorum]|uniref:hypothetical protein n=1 Tax=Bartonella tribocorum TaxID=85701 RepID=UPI001ABB312E|nr:hypothetical protein [Bartonella tribocorum]